MRAPGVYLLMTLAAVGTAALTFAAEGIIPDAAGKSESPSESRLEPITRRPGSGEEEKPEEEATESATEDPHVSVTAPPRRGVARRTAREEPPTPVAVPPVARERSPRAPEPAHEPPKATAPPEPPEARTRPEPPMPEPERAPAPTPSEEPAPVRAVREPAPTPPEEPTPPAREPRPASSTRRSGAARTHAASAETAPEGETPEYLLGVVRTPLSGGSAGAIQVAAADADAEYAGVDDPAVRAGIDRVRANPADAGAWVDLGNAYARAHRPEEAVKMYRKATALDSGLSAAWNNLCGVHLSEYREEEALAACEHAVSVDPYNAWAHYNTGIALDRLDRIPEALDHYQRALTLDPSLKSARVNPNIVNNRHLDVLKIRLYRDAGGSLSLPLLPGTKGGEK